MGHNEIWASHPANYGKGSRRWCARETRRDADDRPDRAGIARDARSLEGGAIARVDDARETREGVGW